MCFWYLRKIFLKKRGDPLKNFVPHRTDFDLVTLRAADQSTNLIPIYTKLFNVFVKFVLWSAACEATISFFKKCPLI
jgi:hypothetical protein